MQSTAAQNQADSNPIDGVKLDLTEVLRMDAEAAHQLLRNDPQALSALQEAKSPLHSAILEETPNNFRDLLEHIRRQQKAVFESIRSRFNCAAAPLLHKQLSKYRETQPYVGLKVLHNIPCTLSVLLKLEALVESGAIVTTTEPLFVQSDPKAVALIHKTGIRHIPRHEDLKGLEFDIVLDCCAELAWVQPTIGTVEITQTGHIKYVSQNLPFPVVSVDASRVKRVEDAIGSADGFMRALKHFDRVPVDNSSAVVFGFGKVGVGICHRLSLLPNMRVTVVDCVATVLEKAAAAGYTALNAADKAAVHDAVRNANLVVTCTGIKHLIANNYDTRVFVGRTLANIGAEDEFGVGVGFQTGEVLFEGRPVNFALEEPTTIGYLDPAFVAHNDGISLLQAGMSPGVHNLPAKLDAEILDDWVQAHPDQGQTLAKVVGIVEGEWRQVA